MTLWQSLKKALKLDEPGDGLAQDAPVEMVTVKLAELEESQEKLKRVMNDTGFFLGDALVRQDDDRARARSSHS